MMQEQISQFDPETPQDFYKSLSFHLLNDAGKEMCDFPVAVKNLTTAGIIVEIPHPDKDLKTEKFKGCEGVLKIIGKDDRMMVELPGKILWTRNREGDSGVTLGMEVLEPMPMPVRHALEANMAIGARDMKVLWDYWDEIRESAKPVELSEPVEPAPPPHSIIVPEEPAEAYSKGGWWYWLSFGAIVSGLALQFQPSEYLGFLGLLAIFSGSSMVALRSLMSMRPSASPGSAD